MLALVLFLSYPLKAYFLQANLPFFCLLLLLDPALQRLYHFSPVCALQFMQFEIGNIKRQVRSAYIFSADVSDVYAVIVGRVEL